MTTQAFLMHPRDEECLKNMLAVEALPLILQEEVGLQTRMFHKSGASGPIGALGLIAIIRQFGMKPPRTKQQEGAVIWRNFKTDGSTKILAHYFGSWQPGVYVGLSGNGMLCVRMDENPHVVREARQGIVRLAEGQAELTAANFPPRDEGPDARATILDRKPASKTVVNTLSQAESGPVDINPLPKPVITTPIVAKGQALPPSGPTVQQESEEETQELNVDEDQTDWTKIRPGANVFFELDGDYKNAEFLGPLSKEAAGDNELYEVRIGDETRLAKPHELTLVS